MRDIRYIISVIRRRPNIRLFKILIKTIVIELFCLFFLFKSIDDIQDEMQDR